MSVTSQKLRIKSKIPSLLFAAFLLLVGSKTHALEIDFDFVDRPENIDPDFVELLETSLNEVKKQFLPFSSTEPLKVQVEVLENNFDRLGQVGFYQNSGSSISLENFVLLLSERASTVADQLFVDRLRNISKVLVPEIEITNAKGFRISRTFELTTKEVEVFIPNYIITYLGLEEDLGTETFYDSTYHGRLKIYQNVFSTENSNSGSPNFSWVLKDFNLSENNTKSEFKKDLEMEPTELSLNSFFAHELAHFLVNIESYDDVPEIKDRTPGHRFLPRFCFLNLMSHVRGDEPSTLRHRVLDTSIRYLSYDGINELSIVNGAHIGNYEFVSPLFRPGWNIVLNKNGQLFGGDDPVSHFFDVVSGFNHDDPVEIIAPDPPEPLPALTEVEITNLSYDYKSQQFKISYEIPPNSSTLYWSQIVVYETQELLSSGYLQPISSLPVINGTRQEAHANFSLENLRLPENADLTNLTFKIFVSAD